MNALLEALYKEYTELNTKLQKVAELITAYGGDNPGEKPVPVITKVYPPRPAPPVEYPIDGTWKAKVLFALDEAERPVTAHEVGNILHSYENEKSIEVCLNMATQYCSSLGAAGEIGVEKGYKNKYFLLPNS